MDGNARNGMAWDAFLGRQLWASQPSQPSSRALNSDTVAILNMAMGSIASVIFFDGTLTRSVAGMPYQPNERLVRRIFGD